MEEVTKAANELQIKTENLKLDFQTREQRLKEKEEIFKKEEEQMAKKYPIEGELVELNVRGKHFTTYKSTLSKVEGSMLRAMFSGRHPLTKDAKGRYFIDRSALSFEYVLHFLSTGELLMPSSPDVKKMFESDLEYFGLREEIPLPKIPSSLLSISQMTQLSEWVGEAKEWTLLYRGSRDGFASQNFHSKCNGKAPTVTLVKSTNGNLFGGYTAVPWHSNGAWSSDPQSWLFSLVNSQNSPKKFPCTDANYSIYGDGSYGPSFGGGYDLHISSGANANTNSYSNFGHSFDTSGVNDPKTFLAGSYNFTITELEVFSLQ